jgi:hypothetical protein
MKEYKITIEVQTEDEQEIYRTYIINKNSLDNGHLDFTKEVVSIINNLEKEI